MSATFVSTMARSGAPTDVFHAAFTSPLRVYSARGCYYLERHDTALTMRRR